MVRIARRAFMAVSIVLCLLLVAPVVPADDHLLSRDDAAKLVRERTGGRVLGVESAGDGAFQVRVLIRQGEVRVYRVDRTTGRVR